MTLGLDGSYGKNTAIGIGMWLGIIMAYNVWFVIWPNQKKALGMIDCAPEEKASSEKLLCYFQEQTRCFLCQCCLVWSRLRIFIS